jgi:hypothetical protein
MRRARAAAAWLGLVVFVAVSTSAISAQIGGKPVSGGNPTPGTPQPDPPNLSDRITVSGCLKPAPKSGTTSESPDDNTPSDTRFVLSRAQRVDRLPPDTGGSELAAKTSSSTYRLEGLDSQFSPFVDAKVEVSGEVKPHSSSEAATSKAPTLLVEFIQKTASACQ